MMMVGFHSKDKADKLETFGFNYVINRFHGNQNDYLFTLTDEVMDILDKYFEVTDGLWTNKRCVLILE